MLQDVQQSLGYLSRDSVVRIGEHLNLPASKIYGVATFYNQFRFQPQGRNHIQVCRGTACHVKGSAAILDAVRRELRIEAGQTSRDGEFSLEVVACIGACGLAPVICINGDFHAGVSTKSVGQIIDSYRRKGSPTGGNGHATA
jgi:NADH-quinone oxidoreductase subunit E